MLCHSCTIIIIVKRYCGLLSHTIGSVITPVDSRRLFI